MSTGKGRRTKGAAGEREFLTLLNGSLPRNVNIYRLLGQTRDGGADAKHGRFVIEIKRQENLKVGYWLAQVRRAAEQAGPYELPDGRLVRRIPVLAYRQNRDQWKVLVDMSISDFASFLSFDVSASDLDSPSAVELSSDEL